MKCCVRWAEHLQARRQAAARRQADSDPDYEEGRESEDEGGSDSRHSLSDDSAGSWQPRRKTAKRKPGVSSPSRCPCLCWHPIAGWCPGRWSSCLPWCCLGKCICLADAARMVRCLQMCEVGVDRLLAQSLASLQTPVQAPFCNTWSSMAIRCPPMSDHPTSVCRAVSRAACCKHCVFDAAVLGLHKRLQLAPHRYLPYAVWPPAAPPAGAQRASRPSGGAAAPFRLPLAACVVSRWLTPLLAMTSTSSRTCFSPR